MSKKEFSHTSRCSTNGPTFNDPKLNLRTVEDFESPSSPTSVTSSDKCIFDSRLSDSGVWSGSNIHSEEINTPDSPVSKSSDYIDSPDMKVSGENKTFGRLDSGIDVSVSQQFSELSLNEDNCDGLNNLSSKAKPKENPTNINQPLLIRQKLPQQITLLQEWFQRGEDGDTQLHLAIIHKFIETVYALVRMVPHPDYLNIRNDDRQSPLHLAVLTSQPRLVRLLVCAGAALDTVDNNGNTALHLAVQAADLNCVRALIDPVTNNEVVALQLQYSPHLFLAQNAITDVADNHNYEGLTCVHLAALCGDLDIVRSLLWIGADVNAKEWKGGETSLHLAVTRRDVAMCRLLLSQPGVDVDEMSYAGVTAYQAVRQGRDNCIAEALRNHGADTYLPSDSDDDSDQEMLEVSENGFNGGFTMNGGLVNVGA